MNNVDTFNEESIKIKSDWRALQFDLRQFSVNHRTYLKKLEELESLKSTYSKQLQKFQTRLDTLDKSSQSALTHSKLQNSDKEDLKRISVEFNDNKAFLARIGDTLPRPIETYLRIVVGTVPLCILDKTQKWTYKDQYEKFKLATSIVILIVCLSLLLMPVYSFTDYLFQFLLVWYYCTLTIRESILVVNGSRIRKWWRFHHFLACINNAIILMWPHNRCYHIVRKQMLLYCLYLTFVQTIQFYYQKGLLYRLRALGESKQMDVNLEGVHTWMLRGLGFLVPFLLVVYGIQLYFGRWLLKLHQTVFSCRREWHPQALGILMLIFFIGNVITAAMVLWDKFRQKVAEYEYMANRYEGFWSLLKFLDARQYCRSDSDTSEHDNSRDKVE